jgi:hypothetical protein
MALLLEILSFGSGEGIGWLVQARRWVRDVEEFMADMSPFR